MRCFIAIDMPAEIKAQIEKMQKKIPEGKLKPVEKENLHLTLVFLDELSDFEINKIKEAVKEISFPRFKVHTGKIGVFPNQDFIRVVWVSLEPTNTFKELHDLIYEQIKSIKKFDKRFESHVTLARIRFIEDKKKFIQQLEKIEIPELQFEVKEFKLKKSTLTQQGPIYEDVAGFKLE